MSCTCTGKCTSPSRRSMYTSNEYSWANYSFVRNPYQISIEYSNIRLNTTLDHILGSQMTATDALSYAPSGLVEPTAAETRSMHEFVSLVLEEVPVQVEDIRKASEDDPLLRSVIYRVLTGTRAQRSPMEEQYYLLRSYLTVVEGILVYGGRFVIPDSLRQAVLRLAHEGHPNIDIFKEALRHRVWWPGMFGDAEEFCHRCSMWSQKCHNPPQELQPSDIAAVWTKIAVDLVSLDGHTPLANWLWFPLSRIGHTACYHLASHHWCFHGNVFQIWVPRWTSLRQWSSVCVRWDEPVSPTSWYSAHTEQPSLCSVEWLWWNGSTGFRGFRGNGSIHCQSPYRFVVACSRCCSPHATLTTEWLAQLHVRPFSNASLTLVYQPWFSSTWFNQSIRHVLKREWLRGMIVTQEPRI